MFGSQFYHQSVRKYIIMFGNMFNDIVVRRLNANNVSLQAVSVPLAYGPKEKFLVRITQDPNLDQQVAIQLPRMGFEMTTLAYDGTRRLVGSTRNVKVADDKNKLDFTYVPVPYDMNFSLYAYVRNADDGAQIMEQIVPYFGPEWTNQVRLIPQISLIQDVPTILNTVSIEDTYEGDFNNRRAIIYTFDFTVKGYFYGPVRRQGIIKRSQIDFGIVTGNTSNKITLEDIARTGRSSRIVVQPGLLANGSPTTNSAASIPYTQIQATDDYGFCSNTFFFVDGRKYNPRTNSDEPIS
jgi:T4-like virus Myoviridae tail sheath stabiliser